MASLDRLRYGGVLAAAVLAAGGYAAGALPSGDPGIGPGIAVCVLGAAGLVAAWWRVGDAVHRGAVGMRWLLTTGALWALPLLFAPPLGSRDVYSYACQGAVYGDGLDPYAVSAAAGGCPWLESVAPMWRESTTPYGPVAVALSAAAVWLAGLALPEGHAQLLLTIGLLRVLAIAGTVVIAWYLARLARGCGVDPLAAAWLALLSPLVAVHLLSAAHHDALLAGLIVAGLAIATTSRTAVKVGVVLGLAAAIKVTAVIALPFAFLLLARRARTAAGLAGGAVAAFAAASLVTGLGLGWVRGLPDTSRVVQWTSIPTGVGMAVRYFAGGSTAIAVARVAGLIVLVAVLVVLWLRAARSAGDTRGVIAHCGLAFAATALLSPVFFPWYAVVPLALLAAAVADRRLRWRLAAGVAALSFLVLPDGHGVASLTKAPGAVADVLLVVAAAVWAWRRRAQLPALVKMQRFGGVVDATR